MPIFTLNGGEEQIVIKITSDKCKVSLMSMGESIEDYRENLPPDKKYTTGISVEAFTTDDDGAKAADIGFLNALYFEAEELFAEEISFPLLCDMISSDACGMAEAVTDKRGKIKPSICNRGHNMLYIKELFIEEQYRSQGVGRYLLDNIVPLLSHSLNLCTHACTLTPYPQEKGKGGDLHDASNATADLPRLVRFYEKAGYTKLKGSGYMHKKCTSLLDELLASVK